MPGFQEVLASSMLALVANAISTLIDNQKISYFDKIKIKKRIEIATLEVIEPLAPFLDNEGINEDQKTLLINTCIEELKPYTKDPQPLFEGSLDGQKIFDAKYANCRLPQEITDESLTDVYTLLFERIATLICKIPAAVKDWENHAWAENYKRLDKIAIEIKLLYEKLNSQEAGQFENTDATLNLARRTLAQRIGIEMDLTGLRADDSLSGKLSDHFVHPHLSAKLEKEKIHLETKANALEYFVRQPQCSLITGAPGAGKSTWTQWFQQEALAGDWGGLVLRVKLRSLDTKALPSMQDIFRNEMLHVAPEMTQERLRKWINDKLILFILDGFDEIKPNERSKVLKWIEDLRIAMNNCSLILTSRKLTTPHLDDLTNWQHWEILPFNKSRIVRYIKNWHKNTPNLEDEQRSIDAKKLASKWRSDSTIHPLTSNPLLLSTLLMVNHLDGSLPSGRAELYKRYVDGMLGKWDARRKVSAANINLNPSEKRSILRAFAIYLQSEQKEQIHEEEAILVIEKELQVKGLDYDPLAVLKTLCERSGLIIGPGTFSLVHKSVGEYLVAEAICQWNVIDQKSGEKLDRLLLFANRDDDRWNVVTFLWAGLAPMADVESFIEKCISTGGMPLGYGIIYDQYEQLNTDFKRTQMLRLLNHEIECKFEEGPQYWGVHGMLDHPRLKVPWKSLRGIEPSQLEMLFSRSAHNGIIKWSDTPNIDGKMKDLLWMSIMRHSQDIEDWKICIHEHLPNNAGKLPYFMIATSVAAKFLWSTLDTQLYKKYIKTLSESHLASGKLLSLAMIAILHDLSEMPDILPKNILIFENIIAFYSTLSELSLLDIQQDIITSDFFLEFPELLGIKFKQWVSKSLIYIKSIEVESEEDKSYAAQVISTIEELGKQLEALNIQSKAS